MHVSRSRPDVLNLAIFISALSMAAAACGGDGAADPVNFDDLDPIAVPSTGKADGASGAGHIACGHNLEGQLHPEAVFQVFDFEATAGTSISVVAAVLEGRADLVVGLFALGVETDGALAANDDCKAGTTDACLREVDLPFDGAYRLLVTSVSRGAKAVFRLDLECHEPSSSFDEERFIGTDGLMGEGCRQDEFFVEANPGGSAPAEGFGDALDRALEALGRPVLIDWLCEDGDAVCHDEVDGRRLVEIAPVLRERRGLDGHRRFFRVSFAREVRRGAVCDVVETLRGAADVLAGPQAMRVGRECAVQILGAEDFADRDMLAWHLDRIGAGAPSKLGAPLPGTSTVDVALIDTGVDADVAAALGIKETDILGRPGEPKHAHGSAMAAFIRQITPRSQIHSVRFMDRNGIGDTADLARSIDAVVHDIAPRRRGARPLVINLSVGWPPELSMKRSLHGDDACETFEDGVGEAVRHSLDFARRVDSPVRPLSVVAAAGNRHGTAERNAPLYRARFGVARGARDPGRCSGAPDGPSWFYPAEWHHACKPLALGVGAVDAMDRAAVISIDGAEPPLVAPAELVYAWTQMPRRAPSGDVCAADVAPPALRRPASLTGTSIGAALVSGAIARLQGERRMASSSAAHLIYMAAAELGRPAPRGGSPVRRLDVGRAVEAANCTAARRCVDALPHGISIGRDALSRCRAAIDACGLPPVAVAHAIRWPAGFDPERQCATRGASPAGPWLDADQCGSAGCPFELLPDRHAAGYAGPQPNWPGCPDCALVKRPDGEWRVVVQPHAGFGADAKFDRPYLVVRVHGRRIYRALPDDWMPGQLTVTGVDLPKSLDPAGVSAAVVVELTEPHGHSGPVREVAGLRVF